MPTLTLTDAPLALDAGGVYSSVTVAVPSNGRPVWLTPKGVRVMPGQSVTVPCYKAERVMASSPGGSTSADVTLTAGTPVPDVQPAGPLIVYVGQVLTPGLYRSNTGDHFWGASTVPCFLDEALTQPAAFPLTSSMPNYKQLWTREPGSYFARTEGGKVAAVDLVRGRATNLEPGMVR